MITNGFEFTMMTVWDLSHLAFIDSSIAMSSLWIFKFRILAIQLVDNKLIVTFWLKTIDFLTLLLTLNYYLCILAMKLSPSPWGPESCRKSKPWKSIGVNFFVELELAEELENFLEKLFQFGSRPDWRSQKVDPGPALAIIKFYFSSIVKTFQSEMKLSFYTWSPRPHREQRVVECSSELIACFKVSLNE